MSMALTVPIDGSTKGLERALREATGEIQGFGRRMSGTMRNIAGSFAAAFAGVEILGFLGDSIGAASDLEESGAKAGQIFGQGFVDELSTFAAGAATELGMSQLQALDAQSLFGVFGKAAGLAGEDLVDFSQDFTTLAADMASFNNATPEEAIEAIGAGMRGESEPLRRFGVLLDDATLRARAMEEGLWDGEGAFTAQTRALAAAAEIMAQTGDQQGDFARTSDGLANQQRILKAQFENVKAELGAQLLPIMLQFVSWLNTTGIPVMRDVATTVRDALGAAIEWAAAWWDEHGATVMTVMQTIWTVAQEVFDQLWRYIQSSFEIIEGVWNIFAGIFRGDWDQFWQGIKGVFSGIWDQIKQSLDLAWEGIKFVVDAGWEAVKALFSAAKDALIDAVSLAVSTILTFFQNLPGNILDVLGDLGRLLYDAGVAIIQGLWDGMKAMWDNVTGWVSGLAGAIAGLKGPLDYDRQLLIPAGEAIMKGLDEGLRGGWSVDVVPTLEGMTDALASPRSMVSAGPAGGVAGAPVVVQVVLDGRVIAESVAEHSQRLGGLPFRVRNAG